MFFSGGGDSLHYGYDCLRDGHRFLRRGVGSVSHQDNESQGDGGHRPPLQYYCRTPVAAGPTLIREAGRRSMTGATSTRSRRNSTSFSCWPAWATSTAAPGAAYDAELVIDRFRNNGELVRAAGDVRDRKLAGGIAVAIQTAGLQANRGVGHRNHLVAFLFGNASGDG